MPRRPRSVGRPMLDLLAAAAALFLAAGALIRLGVAIDAARDPYNVEGE